MHRWHPGLKPLWVFPLIPSKSKSESLICSTFNSPNVSVLDFSAVLSLMGSNVRGKHVVLVNKWWQAPFQGKNTLASSKKKSFFKPFTRSFPKEDIILPFLPSHWWPASWRQHLNAGTVHGDGAGPRVIQRWGAAKAQQKTTHQSIHHHQSARRKSLIVLAFGESPMVGNNENKLFSRKLLDSWMGYS